MGFSVCCGSYDARINVNNLIFAKMSKSEIETRYNKAFFKTKDAMENKGVTGYVKVWIENNNMYIASDKKIALINPKNSRDYPWKYLGIGTELGLQTIDFRNVVTSMMKNRNEMFTGMNHLKTIYLSDSSKDLESTIKKQAPSVKIIYK